MRRGRGLPLSQLAGLYQVADVHLLASIGEGFGLPNLQAAAAGTVPLAGAHSACPELVEGHGQVIAVADWIEDEFGIRRGLIDVSDGAQKLSTYYDDGERLRRDAVQSRAFALSYRWEAVIDEWDVLLRSLRDEPPRPQRLGYRTQATVKVAAPNLFGASLTATVRAFDHVEALLKADVVPGREIGLPASPPRGRMHGHSLPRRPGLIGVPPGETPEFGALRAIFPILDAWSPIPIADASAECFWLYRLAESVMLMNLGGTLPDEVLIAAAVLRVPCVGARQSALQLAFWPELSLDRRSEGVDRGRELLTNLSLLYRMIANAERVCEQLVTPQRRRAFISFRDG